MATVEIRSDALRQIIEQLNATPQRIQDALEPANHAIITAMQAHLLIFYGPRLAARWITESAVGFAGNGGALANVRVKTSDPFVMGYEFGTKAHVILPSKMKALSFMMNGQQVFASRVQHPGTPAHNRRLEVQQALSDTAQAIWLAALTDALPTLE